MPIIIEGPDGAGKTTLAEKLAKRLDLNIIKMTANGGQSFAEYCQKLGCKGVVVDRCWISEQIYADLFGRDQRIGDDDCRMLTEACFDGDIPVIILLPPLHVVIQRLSARGDEFEDVVLPNIERIYARYKAWAEDHPQAIVVEGDDVDEVIAEVLKCML